MTRIIETIYVYIPVRLATGILTLAFGINTMIPSSRGLPGYLATHGAAWVPTAYGTLMAICGLALVYRAFNKTHALLSVFIVLCVPQFVYFTLAFVFWLSDISTPFAPIIGYIGLTFFMLVCFWQEQKISEGKLNEYRRNY